MLDPDPKESYNLRGLDVVLYAKFQPRGSIVLDAYTDTYMFTFI